MKAEGGCYDSIVVSDCDKPFATLDRVHSFKVISCTLAIIFQIICLYLMNSNGYHNNLSLEYICSLSMIVLFLLSFRSAT